MKKLYLLKLLIKDIAYRKITCITIFTIVAIVNCLFVLVHVCSGSFHKGIENATDRLGADIVIVSSEFDDALQDLLFMGYPSTVIFEADFYDELQKCSVVKNVTKHLFLSSLDSDCCESEVQFIVFDEETDTLIHSLTQEYISEYETRDILIGADIELEIGDKVTFFDCVFHVAGKLARTGMGYDDCIFVNRKVGESVLNYLRIENDESKTSMLLIDIRDKRSLDTAYKEISDLVKGKDVAVFKTNEIFRDVSEKVSLFVRVSYLFIIALEILSTISLTAIFTLSVEVKKSSLEALNIMGVSNRGRALLLISEGILISFVASAIGGLCGLILLLIFRKSIESVSGFHILLNHTSAAYIVCGIIVSLIIAIIANLYSAYLSAKVGNGEI